MSAVEMTGVQAVLRWTRLVNWWHNGDDKQATLWRTKATSRLSVFYITLVSISFGGENYHGT